MVELEFEALMQDRRLAPLTQLMALKALDGDVSTFHSDPLKMSHLFRAALAPFCCAADERDVASVCAAVLRDVCGCAEAPRCSIEDGELTPAFVVRSNDRCGLLAERRFKLQLRRRQSMMRNALSRAALH